MGGYKEKRSLNDDLKIARLSNWENRVDIYLNGEDCEESKFEAWEGEIRSSASDRFIQLGL